VPAAPLTLLTETPFADAAEAVPVADELAAAAAVALELDVELLLPQPATINATPTSAAAPTERIFAVVQFAIVCCSQLVVFSGPVGGGGSWTEDPGGAGSFPGGDTTGP